MAAVQSLLLLAMISVLVPFLVSGLCTSATEEEVEEVQFNFTLSVPSLLTTIAPMPVVLTFVILEEPFTIYSMELTLTVERDLGSDVQLSCALIWLDSNGDPILASNIVNSPQGVANQFHYISSSGHIQSTHGMTKLCNGETVTGALLIGDNICKLSQQDSWVNTSGPTVGATIVANTTEFVYMRINSIEVLARKLLGIQQINIPAELIATVAVLPVAFVFLIIMACVMSCIRCCTKSQKQSSISAVNSVPTSFESSLMPNLTYNTYIIGNTSESIQASNANSTNNRLSNTSDIIEWIRVAKGQRRRRVYELRTFNPRFGVLPPIINFTKYNQHRAANDWEYNRNNLIYLRDIGEGQFGKVLLMRASNIAGYEGELPVAVKTLTSTDEEDLAKFLKEVKLMKKFCHKNIVSLIGEDINSCEGSAPLMILEYMPYGDLKTFLEEHRNTNLIQIEHQLKFAKDVALGLQYLASNRYVHRDTAARNCLIGSRLDVKLADFGLTIRVSDNTPYQATGQLLLPVRWTAPESLLHGVFTSASDVWSYGVLLWEIATFGQQPYNNKQPNEILQMARNQSMMLKWPRGKCEVLRILMLSCHQFQAENRPSFTKLIELLS